MENDYKALWMALKSILNKLKENNYLYFNSLDKKYFMNKTNEITSNKQLQENDYLNMQRGYYYNSSKDILEEMKKLEQNLCNKDELRKDELQARGAKSYKFEGWDWEEIGKAFKLEQPELPYDSDPFMNLRAQRIKEYVHSLKGEKRKKAISIMREFLNKLILDAEKNKMGITLLPIWREMCKLEEDEDFCYVFLSLMETLWT